MVKSKGRRRCGAGFEISSARESLISALVSSGFHHQEFLIREAASYLFCCATVKSLDYFLTFGEAFFIPTSLLIKFRMCTYLITNDFVSFVRVCKFATGNCIFNLKWS
jgi:hypothetical protein